MLSDIDLFRIFNIDMGDALDAMGIPNRLHGVPLWQVVSREDHESLSLDHLRQFAENERRERARRLAELVADGLTLDDAFAKIGPPLYADWQS